MKRLTVAMVVAAAALSVTWGQSPDAIRFTAIKEIQVKRGTEPLTAEILAELANSGAPCVIKDAVFTVRFSRPGFNPVDLPCAQPSDEVELDAGSAVKPGRAVIRILVNVGKASEGAADRIFELFNMISRRDKSSDLKVVLDGTMKMAVQTAGQSMSFNPQEVRLQLIPEAGKSDVLLR